MTENKIIKKFRYDINALRAIAIIGVLLFHYQIHYFAGGFAGVDVFFVISGYLMSRIIVSSMDNGRFSFIDFYSKRVKRIIPALLFIILIVALLGFFIFFPGDYQLNETNAAVSNAFISNIFYWQHSNYFDPSSNTNIFLHTWSLSVEWQFYLLYPVILLALITLLKNRTHFVFLYVFITVGILVYSIHYATIHPSAAFYLLPTRSWEMMFGGIAFLLENKINNDRVKKLLAITGYIIIFICLIFLKTSMVWPGKFTLLPVIATLIVIISNANDFKVLKNPGVQFIGKISYSLYLWHWPVYVIAQYLGIRQNNEVIILLICMSFVMAYLSYRYIESIEFKTRGILSAAAVSLTFVTLISFINVNSIMFKKKSLDIAFYKSNNAKLLDKQFDAGGCFITSLQTGIADFNKQRCLKIEKGKKNILLLGDSHAADLSMSLGEALEKENINLMKASSSGCLPLLKDNGEDKSIQLKNYIYYNFIVNNSNNIDGVIISADWSNATADERIYLLKDINATTDYLKRYKINTIIIGQNETFTMPYAVIAAREYEYNISIVHNYVNIDAYNINKLLNDNLPKNYVNIYRADGYPPLFGSKIPYMFDENHFTKYGADLAVKTILSNPNFITFISALNLLNKNK